MFKSKIIQNLMAMIKIKIIIFLLSVLTLSSCLKEPNSIDWEQLRKNEVIEREQYLKDNNITVAPTKSGLYYIETSEGTGEIPTEGVNVEVIYEGSLLDGSIFDSGTFKFRYGVGLVIPGFDEAISYMKKGGKATAIIPSELAYGAYEAGSVPPYSTLVFDIELSEVYGLEKEIEDRNQYILDNSITADSTASGLYYIETLAGEGAVPTENDLVEVKYVGRFLDGSIFDSETINYNHGVGQVISGWDEAIDYMKEGGKASIIIPSKLGYGPVGNEIIPGYTTLLFDVELIRVSAK